MTSAPEQIPLSADLGDQGNVSQGVLRRSAGKAAEAIPLRKGVSMMEPLLEGLEKTSYREGDHPRKGVRTRLSEVRHSE